MRTKSFAMTSVALIALLGAGAVHAADTTFYVVHGINGDDFDLDRELPVDVWVSGLGCALPNFQFGQRVGPVTVPAGEYDIRISLADGNDPCEGTAVISLPGVALQENANVTLIAHRTAVGTEGAGDLLGLGVTASGFPNDFSTTAPGTARVIAHHTAYAPTVDVIVSRNYNNPNAPGVSVEGFTNPTADTDAAISQILADFKPGSWDVALEVDGAAVFGPDRLTIAPGTATYIYAVGDFAGGTFEYLVYTETGLKAPGGSDERPSDERPSVKRKVR